ncbi:probable phosphoglycerate mutase [Austwickia chelonae]|uniref:Putative ribonuclease H/acid phosphatase n=1 Tax=Austwickia chelonae NBRC 105200 TaxID=1184607 RepID=K6W623_9MICO|nr:bifunctional RNase H/acid phosphatase [Austwickia chelonae]GAB77277.1 putative ribonuclease H/acid phosphatase [Austwickia chelonae NBRC 105200]SEW06782.1 probable phosphoglycerate mutase [Austwickia chelonae]
MLVVEADGGSRGNPGVAGYGALVRDAETGRVLRERAEPLGKASNNVAEYSGLIAGLQAAAEVDPAADVDVRMDSKLVVEQMSGRWKIKHEDMRRLADEARLLVAARKTAGGKVTFAWIPRERNKAADALSNVAMDGKSVDRVHSSSDQREKCIPLEDVAGSDEIVVSRPEGRSAAAQAARDAVRAHRDAEPDLAPPTQIFLVRHGITESNSAGLLDGRGGSDAPLTSEGRQQASLLAKALSGRFLDGQIQIVSSSLTRAQQTGAIIAAEFGVPLTTDGRWDEQHFGDWEGYTVARACREDSDAYEALRRDPSYARPGGESRAQLAARVLESYEALTSGPETQGKAVVVVSHRAAMLTVLDHVLGLRSPWSLTLAPASLTRLRRWQDGVCAIDVVNDTHHLRFS